MGYAILRLDADSSGICEGAKNFLAAGVVLARRLGCAPAAAQKLLDNGRVFAAQALDGAGGGAGAEGSCEKSGLSLGAASAHARVILPGASEQNLRGQILPLSAAAGALPLAKGAKISPAAPLAIIVYLAEPQGLQPLCEREDFAVFSKPAGLLSHPAGRHSAPSLSDEIWARWGAGAAVAHRLDAATSGLIICAKNPAAAKALKAKFAAGEVQKTYELLARGSFAAAFCVAARLGLRADAKTLKNKMHPRADGAICRSEFYPLCTGELADLPFAAAGAAGKFSALRCVLHTGRQHQIRAHLAAIGSAVLGDALYGVSEALAAAVLDGRPGAAAQAAVQSGAARLCLHSAGLKFSYGGEEFELYERASFLQGIASGDLGGGGEMSGGEKLQILEEK